MAIHSDREARILDAAVELIVHYGYDKTTVEDIARHAGISKGAIYLHFAGKEALFEKLFEREVFRYADAWLARIEADPNGGSLAAMYVHMLQALKQSPFLSAMFRRDQRVFGTYLRKPGNFFQSAAAGRARSPRADFVARMQEAGAIRRDIQPEVIAHIMNMLAYSLAGMDEVIPTHDVPELDDVITGIGLLLDQALTPPGGGNPDAAKAIIRELVDAARRQRLPDQPAQQETA